LNGGETAASGGESGDGGGSGRDFSVRVTCGRASGLSRSKIDGPGIGSIKIT